MKSKLSITTLWLFSLLLSTNLYAQKPTCSVKQNTAYGGIKSKEYADNAGSFDVNFYIVAKDTTYIDSVGIELPSMLSISAFNHSAGASAFTFENNYYLPGDTLFLSITVAYNAQNLPYYPKQVAFYGKTHNLNEINGSFKITGVVYFTLYNTVEVWNINDFHKQPRLWIMETSPAPERKFISKDSIPVSNIIPNSLITEEWQRKYRLKKVSGLPYYIKMMPLHPDTVAAMKLRDSIESGTRGLGKGGFTLLRRRFHGHVTGTIRAGYTNDVNILQTLNLKGIQVVAYDLDDWWNDELGSDFTDENGNYDISYNSYQWEAHIELFVTISTLGNTNTGVYESDANPCFWNDEYELSTGTTNVSYGTDKHNDFGVWNLPAPAREPFKILNWANRAQDFVTSQVGSIARERLKIFCYGDGSYFSTFPCQHVYLFDVDVSHESVIWHEMGHYLMGNLSGSHISAGGDHWFENECIFTRA
jgi:hypothetical protein